MPVASGRRGRQSSINYWPGFVDALSTLLLGIIFLLSIFAAVWSLNKVTLLPPSITPRSIEMATASGLALVPGVSRSGARLSYLRSDRPSYGRSIERVSDKREAEMVTSDTRHAAPPLRLTRRGRVVLLGFYVLISALASVVLFTTASHG